MKPVFGTPDANGVMHPAPIPLGRPFLNPRLGHRVQLAVRISTTARERIEAQALRLNISMGQIVDRLAMKLPRVP